MTPGQKKAAATFVVMVASAVGIFTAGCWLSLGAENQPSMGA
jgi:hypothetical protein